MSIRQQLHKLSYQAHGAKRTIKERHSITGRLASYLQAKNIQIKDIKYLKFKHVQAFIEHRRSIGVTIIHVSHERETSLVWAHWSMSWFLFFSVITKMKNYYFVMSYCIFKAIIL